MTESTAPHKLRLVRGGRYRNAAGGELLLIELLTSATTGKYGLAHLSTFVSGGLWIAEDADEMFGTTQHLVTREGLLSCGYSLISEPGDDTPARKSVAPAEFGEVHYGVRLFSHEDEWGWTAYGHHDPRRIVAACVAATRAAGVLEDLREHTAGTAFFDKVEQTWAVSVESSHYDFEIKFCDRATPGAVPVTVVTA
jgi:hypothetical protein